MSTCRIPHPSPALLATVLLAWALTAVFPNRVLAERLILAADAWCPFNCAPEADLPGFMIDIARAVFEESGHTVEYVVMPWKRAVDEARNGGVDGVVGALRDDAPGFIFPDNESGMARIGFYTLKDSDWTYSDRDSVGTRVFGTARGYSYGREIDAMIAEKVLKVDEVGGISPLVYNLCKLREGRIDAVVAERSALESETLRLNITDEIRYAGSPEEGEPVYIAFAPGKPRSGEYARMLSRGMDALRKSGRLEAILKRYGVRDWK
jgi:polar amino acid transport system substrate-binding protein